MSLWLDLGEPDGHSRYSLTGTSVGKRKARLLQQLLDVLLAHLFPPSPLSGRVMTTRRKPQIAQKSKDLSKNSLPGITEPASPDSTTTPPARPHSSSYHFPLLISSKNTSYGLLDWFFSIENDRQMPWRKKWIDTKDFADDDEGCKELAKVLEKRAYEVWVSEIMLQQTRVSTVIPYFNNWIAKWPTVRDLAAADRDDVFAVWKGLGYYQRASRLHQGAIELAAGDKGSSICIIPDTKDGLLSVSGIGPYTAGAITSIAFGRPEPVLDGNVIRVLSRQLGLYVDGKDKKSSDLLWKVADRLVKHVSDYPDTEKSATPGQWNQALMELGSTVCTPRPKCEECPIQRTCRVFAEGDLLVKKKIDVAVADIEDACTICAELDTEDLVFAEQAEEAIEDTKVIKKRKRETNTKTKTTNAISNYFTSTRTTRSKVEIEISETVSEKENVDADRKRKAPEPTANDRRIASYCSLFPKKVVKKKIAEEECCVCLIEVKIPGEQSKWLIEQRPDKGKSKLILIVVWTKQILSPFTRFTRLAMAVPSGHA